MWEIDRITSISLSKPAIGYWIEQLLRQIRFTFNASINSPLLRATDEMIIASINKERQTRERERETVRESARERAIYALVVSLFISFCPDSFRFLAF